MSILKNKTHTISMLIFIIGIALSCIATYFVWKDDAKISEQRLEISVNEISAKIQSRLKAYIQFSQSSASYFMASDTITRDEWKFFVEKSDIGNYLNGVQGVAYIPKIVKQNVQTHISYFKNEFSENYTIFPTQDTDIVTPIVYIEPLAKRNLKAIGFNISTNPNMKKALQESVDLNTSILTNKVTLIQEGTDSMQPGIVIYSPVFHKNLPINTIAERRKAIKSWTAISFRMKDFMIGVLEPFNKDNVRPIYLKIFDGSQLTDANLLFNSDTNVQVSEMGFHKMTLPINLTDKNWTLQFLQEKNSFFSSFSFVVLIFGFIMSSLLSILVFSLVNTAHFAKRIAKNLTVDLSQKNEELSLAKETAEESEKQLKSISNNLVKGMIYQVVLVDESKRAFTYISDIVNELYGCTVEEAKNDASLIYSKIHKDDIADVLEKEQISLQNMTVFKTEARVINPDGSLRWSYYISKPRIIKGNVCWDGIEIDITDQKKVENELIAAKAKAEESNRLKTEFLNNMSHEIRTPMNGILGFTDFLLTPNLPEEKKNSYIQIIKSCGIQLLQVIDDILEISRLGTKQVSVIETEVCLNDLLLELFTVFDIKAKENKIPLYIKNTLTDAESTIISDKSKLIKIISNLLENALKFTKTGHIELGYKLIENQIEIYVKDTGIGIEKEKHQLIFERFSQAERDLSKKAGGLGLGLSIVKENVELIGGTIHLESEKGAGATFYIKLPYNKVFDVNQVSTSSTNTQRAQTILIAEDEEVNYLFLETLINDVLKINCHVLHAKDGKEAIEICTANNSIDLVLMDLKMPIIDGFEAAKELKKLYPNLTIIAQSAYTSQEELTKVIKTGFDDFISKPIHIDTFKKLINKHLFSIVEED